MNPNNLPHNVDIYNTVYIQYSQDIEFDYSNNRFPSGDEEGFYWEDTYIPITHRVDSSKLTFSKGHVWRRERIGYNTKWGLPQPIGLNNFNLNNSINLVLNNLKVADPIYINDKSEISHNPDYKHLPEKGEKDTFLKQGLNDAYWYDITNDFYTKQNLITPGQASIHIDNIIGIQQDPITAVLNPLILVNGELSHSNDNGFKHIPIGGNSGDFLSTNGNGIYTWKEILPFPVLTDDSLNGNGLLNNELSLSGIINNDIKLLSTNYQYFSQIKGQDTIGDKRLNGNGNWERCYLGNNILGNGSWIANNAPSSLTNNLGNWNANTNTPLIENGIGNSGDWYIVNVSGLTNIDGISVWYIGDYIWFDSSTNKWQKINNQTGTSISTPGGVNQNVQFNNNGVFGGSNKLNWDGNQLRFNSSNIIIDDNLVIQNDSFYLVSPSPLSVIIDGVGEWIFNDDGSFIIPITNSVNYNESKLYYDNETKNFKFCEANGTIADLNRESIFYIKNQTGNTLLNLRAIEFDGSLGTSGRLKGKYALASPNVPSIMVIGITTENIINGDSGKVTFFGEVTGNTTGGQFGEVWEENDILYVSNTNAGYLTKNPPQAPYPAIPIAVVTNVHSVNGHLTVRPTYPQKLTELSDVNGTPLTTNGQILVWQGDGDGGSIFDFTHNINDYTKLEVFSDSGQLTGFPFGSDIDISYNYTNRTITLTGNLSYYFRGIKRQLGNGTTWTSTVHTNSIGLYFLHSIDGINFVWTTSPWDFVNVMVAFVNRTNDINTTFAIRETHRLLDPEAHESNHLNLGTYRKSGGTATTGTFILNTTTDSAITPGFDSAVLSDEDLDTNISAWLEGTYTTLYIDSNNKGIFSITDNFPFKFTINDFIQYNDSNGNLVTGINNKFYNIYQILIPTTSDSGSQKFRTVFLQSQNQYDTENAALAEDTRSLRLGDLVNLTPEFNIHSRLTYRTNSSYTTTGKVQLANITYVSGTRYGQISVTGYNPSSHNLLTDVFLASEGNVIKGHISSSQYDELITGYFKETQVVTRLSTSTFSLPIIPSTVKAGMAIKYSSDNITYYDGLISNITGTTVTVRGVELPSTINYLYYSLGEVVELTYPLSDGSLNAVVDNVNTLYDNLVVLLNNSKLLAITTICVGNDTIASQIQIRKGTIVNGARVLTDSNDILTANLEVKSTYSNTGVTINPLYNTFGFEEFPIIDCLNIGNGNATGIMLKFYFIKNW